MGWGISGVGLPAKAGILVHAPNGREIATGAGVSAQLPELAGESDRLPKGLLLSDGDVARYRLIFELQERGAFNEADAEIARLESRILVGDVLAQRYLRPGHKTKYADLAEWMQRYADLADAERIHALAVARQPAGQTPPKSPRSRTTRRGGALEQLGGFRPEPGPEAVIEADAAEDTPEFERTEPDRPISVVPRSRAGFRPDPSQSADQQVEAALQAGKPSTALALLLREDVGGKLDQQTFDTSRSRVAANLYYSGQVEEALSLASASAARSGGVVLQAHWIAGLSAWRLKRTDTAAEHFEALAKARPNDPWLMAAAAFWAARTASKRGDEATAKQYLGAAARYPHTFYGLVAARALGTTPRLDWNVPAPSAAQFTALSALPGGRRALALLQVGRRESAESELLRIDPRGDRQIESLLVTLADRAGLPVLALKLGTAVLRPDGAPFDAALYPVPHWRPRDGFQIDRALVYAVMRQESRFDVKLVSSAGATGLMQVLPATASHVGSRNTDLGNVDRAALTAPATNLELGQRYLSELLSMPEIDNNLILALAAYNAGPGNLQRWRRELNRVKDPFLFIESLPFAETRDYVEKVMANYWLYRVRLGQDVSTLDIAAAGGWPIAPHATQAAQLP